MERTWVYSVVNGEATPPGPLSRLAGPSPGVSEPLRRPEV